MWDLNNKNVLDVRNYFGELIAMYFAYVHHLIKLLVPLAGVGVLSFLLQVCAGLVAVIATKAELFFHGSHQLTTALHGFTCFTLDSLVSGPQFFSNPGSGGKSSLQAIGELQIRKS